MFIRAYLEGIAKITSEKNTKFYFSYFFSIHSSIDLLFYSLFFFKYYFCVGKSGGKGKNPGGEFGRP
jgi:Ni,Fe-hydrogenase I cytochrome b subunit